MIFKKNKNEVEVNEEIDHDKTIPEEVKISDYSYSSKIRIIQLIVLEEVRKIDMINKNYIELQDNIFNKLEKMGFLVRRFSLENLINMNYQFLITKVHDDLDESRYFLIDLAFIELYKNNNQYIDYSSFEMIGNSSDGIKIINDLNIYCFTKINQRKLNKYLSTFSPFNKEYTSLKLDELFEKQKVRVYRINM